MKISVILKLPSSLLIEIFSHWVYVEELARLDSALAGKRVARQRYLELLSSPFLSSSHNPESRITDGVLYLCWLSVRQVAMRELVLHSADLVNFNLRCPMIGFSLRLQAIKRLEVQGSEHLYSLVKAVVSQAMHLRVLKFSSLVWLTYPRLRAMLKTCHNTIQELQIDSVKYLCGSNLIKLIPYWRNLRVLSLGRRELHRPFVEALTVNCRHLTQFQFSSSPVHTDSLLSLIQSFTPTQTNSSVSRTGQARAISTHQTHSTTICQPRLLHTNQLISIALTYNTGVRLNRIGTCIADNCRALISLTLVGEYDINDALSTETLTYLAQRCRKLQYIDVSKNNYIENSAIICIAENCTDLRHLIIHSCRRLSDEAVSSVSQNCAHLQVLDLSWCDNITNASLQLLSSANAGLRSSLRELKINSCYRITSQADLELLMLNCKLLTAENVSMKYTYLL